MEDISYRDYANLITDLQKAKLLIEDIDKDFTTMRQQCYHCAKQHHIFDEDHNAVFQLYTEMDFIEEILETECFQYYQLCQWAQKQVTNMPIQIKQLLNNDPNLDLQIQNYLKSIKPIGQIGNTYLDIHNNNYEGSIEWFNNLQKLCLDKTISDGQNSVLNFITFQADQKGDFYYQQWTKLRSLLFSKFLASFKQNFPYFKDVINFGYTIDYQFMVYNYQYQDISINNTLKEMGRILQQVLIQFFMHNSQELNIEKVEQIKKTILDIQTGFDKQYIIVLHLLGYTLTKLRKFTKDINVDDILQKLFYQRQICKDELHAQNVDTYILNIIQSHDCAQLQERIILKLLDEQKGNQNNMEEFLLKLKTQNNFYFIKLALENLNCYVDEFIIIDLIKTFYQDWEIIYQFQRLMDKIISYGNFTKIKLKYPRKLEAFQFLINTFPNRFDTAEYIYNMMTDRLFAFQNLDKLQKVQMLPKWQRKILIQLINFCDTLGDLEIIKEYIEGTFQDLNLSRLPKCMDIVRAMTIRLEQLVPDYINLLLL